MIDAARAAAAIEILDDILQGTALEAALTQWGRAHRFAGSGDRAAIRDLVFDALRCRRSFGALGGGGTGRGLILGGLRDRGLDEGAIFSGLGHAPSIVADADTARAPNLAESLDCPDWLAPMLRDSLGHDFEPVMLTLRQRAPVTLRVNLVKASLATAQSVLLLDGIETVVNPAAPTALIATTQTRKIQRTPAYLQGLVELQDAGSQAIVQALPLSQATRVLDYCAGGGGKALAMAAITQAKIYCFDAIAHRMADIAPRAMRAGVQLDVVTSPENHAPYDLVLIDAPCTGSGSWRRDPQGKWALSAAKLQQTLELQAEILAKAAPLVGPGGVLAYATCSVLKAENADQVSAFLQKNSDWRLDAAHIYLPNAVQDGFYLANLRRN